MKKNYLILFLVFASIHSFAQYFSLDTIKGESPYNKEFSFIFPHLKSATDQTIADAINTELVKDILNIDYGQQRRSIFENIWGMKEMDLPTVSNISFQIINNDEDFFSIKISATSCGESCHDWSKYYIYDSKSGKKVLLNDLLSGTGVVVVSDSANHLFLHRQNIYASQLKDKIAKQPLSDEDKQAYQSAIDSYTKCTGKNNLWIALDKRHLYVYTDGCISGELHYLDKVDYSAAFDVSVISDYLTDYGKSILKK